MVCRKDAESMPMLKVRNKQLKDAMVNEKTETQGIGSHLSDKQRGAEIYLSFSP
jgi:hypothetical protein